MLDDEAGEAPVVSETYFTSRDGVRAVDGAAADMRCVWRETPLADIGIDGQLEHLDDRRRATGGLVAVQVKSGRSYMNVQGDAIVFHPEAKHRRYWESFPVPVLLVIHDPDSGNCYWEDARRVLRSPMTRGSAIRVPLSNILCADQKARVFEHCGILGRTMLSVEPLVAEMARRADANDITFLDLFLLGLTDVAHSLFFHVGIYVDLMEVRRGHFDIDQDEYQFVHDYVHFLLEQRLIRYDIGDFVIDWEHKEMTPVFIAKLTTRGRSITNYLHERTPSEASGVACEGFVGLVRESVFRKFVGLRPLIEAVRHIAAGDAVGAKQTEFEA